MSEWRVSVETEGPYLVLAARERSDPGRTVAVRCHRRTAAGLAACVRAALEADDDSEAEIITNLEIT